MDLDLFTYKPSPPQVILGDRDGETFDRGLDLLRLNGQALEVWLCMADGQWRTLKEITEFVGCSDASASARVRDFRKPKFGGHTVNRRRFMPSIFEYQLVPNK